MASDTTTKAQEQQTLAGQDHLYDIIALNTWITASPPAPRVPPRSAVARWQTRWSEWLGWLG